MGDRADAAAKQAGPAGPADASTSSVRVGQGTDRLIEWLPSPAGLALWLYALAFVVLPAILAYKGFVYVVGIVLFTVGLRPHIDKLVAGTPVHFEFHWRGMDLSRDFHLRIRNERWAVKLISVSLMLGTILLLPLLVVAIQVQGVAFYAQIEAQLPAILGAIDDVLGWARERVPGYVPDVDVQEGRGWQGVSQTISQLAGDAIKDINAMMQQAFGSVLSVLGTLVGDWVKLIIATLLVGTLLAGWNTEVAMHRGIVARGIRHDRLRANVLRFGELFQSGISLFMIGYLEVGATLSFLYFVSMLILPTGLGIGAILFVALILGFVTAIPKIGSFLGMAFAAVLMGTNIEPGLGWFGYQVISFGTAWDVLIRTVLLVGLTKILGLLEAYNYTPGILGARLGLTKMQIICTIVIWAVGTGFFGMIWGILISLAFQAALRLAEETRVGPRAAPADGP